MTLRYEIFEFYTFQKKNFVEKIISYILSWFLMTFWHFVSFIWSIKVLG